MVSAAAAAGLIVVNVVEIVVTSVTNIYLGGDFGRVDRKRVGALVMCHCEGFGGQTDFLIW